MNLPRCRLKANQVKVVVKRGKVTGGLASIKMKPTQRGGLNLFVRIAYPAKQSTSVDDA